MEVRKSMKYRNVGKSGLKVSEIALGSWMTNLAGTQERAVAEETIRLAYDSGVNFFDCADGYSAGEAERFLGKVLRGVNADGRDAANLKRPGRSGENSVLWSQ